MNVLKLFFTISAFIFLLSCADDDMTPDYMSDGPKALAIKIEAPEVAPGDPVALQFLAGGMTVDQEMTDTVRWYAGYGVEDDEKIEIGSAAYNEPFIMDPAFWNVIQSTPLWNFFEDQGWLDVPILVQIRINEKAINATKTMRLTKHPSGKNPIISGVRVRYGSEDIVVTDTTNRIISLVSPDIPVNIAFTALTEDLGIENDKLIYRWKVSFSKNSPGKLYINTENSDIEQILGSGAKAAEYEPSAVFSLIGEEGKDGIQSGIYDVYLVVRDKATTANSRAEDRFGLDFFYFTLCVEMCD